MAIDNSTRYVVVLDELTDLLDDLVAVLDVLVVVAAYGAEPAAPQFNSATEPALVVVRDKVSLINTAFNHHITPDLADVLNCFVLSHKVKTYPIKN